MRDDAIPENFISHDVEVLRYIESVENSTKLMICTKISSEFYGVSAIDSCHDL